MSLTNYHINDLITLCKKNNQLAQLEVYNRYYKAMYNTSLRIVKESAEAENIMQDSFLKAFTKLNTLKTDAFGSWLKRIVINDSIAYYQKKTKLNEVPLDDHLYKIEDENEVFEINIKPKINELIAAMNQLKESYRIALSLHLIEGYDYEEMSEILNLSNENCRALISRAKKSLRKKLDKK